MTTLELRKLMADIQPTLERLNECANDYGLADDEQHYDCADDLELIINRIQETL